MKTKTELKGFEAFAAKMRAILPPDIKEKVAEFKRQQRQRELRYINEFFMNLERQRRC